MDASQNVSRRSFLAGAGIAAASMTSGAAAGVAVADEAAHVCGNLPEAWDAEADVVVIGMGAAGLSAAIAAKLDGVESVLVLEAAPEEERGGTTRVSGDMLMIPDDVDGAVAYQTALNGPYEVEPEYMRAWAEGVVGNYDWLTKDLGFVLGDASAARPEFPGIVGGEHIKTYYVDGICGYSSLWNPLVAKAEELGVEFAYNARAVDLIYNYETKEVYGLSTEDGRTFKARKGVVMACGGFSANPEMLQNYSASMGAPRMFYLGTPYAQGDGVKMAQKIGADLWHMNSYAAASNCVRTVGLDSGIADICYPTGHDYIFVNNEGKRFMYEEERGIQRHGKQKSKGIWPLLVIPTPSYMIMGAKSGSIDMLRLAPYMTWSTIMDVGYPTNQDLVDAGIMVEADTIEEIAEKIGYPPEVLAETVAAYNGYCDDGVDPEFGRGREVYTDYMFDATAGKDAVENDGAGEGETEQELAIMDFDLERLEPPFRAIEIAHTLLNTQGGAKRNGLCQVLSVEGEPIPRLYAAGEFGTIYAYMYNGGGNCSEAVATGRVAGQQVAALGSWEA